MPFVNAPFTFAGDSAVVKELPILKPLSASM
jgi:hypothetical protein